VFTRNALTGEACAKYPIGNTCPTIAPALPGVDRAELERKLEGVK
jgi:hypothetical protein